MELVKSDNVVAQLRGLSQLPVLRQLGLLIGLAASVALGVGLALWSQEPNYKVLYSQLSDKDAVAVTAALDQASIPYRLAEGSGAVLVPASDVHGARLRLASQGLPNGAGVGFELLDEKQGFGVSQFMETARYQRAIEGELARTISSLAHVDNARIHLALPKRTAFVREQKDPSASVMLRLFPGYSLEEGQVAAIVHLVAASVPNLSADKVTVVDQTGRLLTRTRTSEEGIISDRQFDYRRRLEDYYIKRIESIVAPIVGPGSVRAQVSAEIDFTVTEQTQETFNPDLPALRSEQTLLENDPIGAAGAVGIPGAVSNQPPETASDVQGVANAAEAPETIVGNGAAGKSVRRSVRNYELDKTISHTRLAAGGIRRLSVAVVVDDRQVVGAAGIIERRPLSQQDLSRITDLVKEAVGFSTQRGDTVNVINASFTQPPEPEPLPEPDLLEQPWLWDALKAVLGGVAVLVLVFGVLRPVMRDLAARGKSLPVATATLPPGGIQGAFSGPYGGGPFGGISPANYEATLSSAKSIVSEDPRRVAQVMKTWVGTDGE